jgi:transcriptional regulator with XRE-family HTH domain
VPPSALPPPRPDTRDAPDFGTALRRWRQQRRLTQLDLALAAEVSTRHLSWLETGRAQPSRAMVLRLAERLDVPPRERNRLLALAGFAPLFGERRWDDASFAMPREAVQRLLDAHEPWPALAVDRHWNVLAHNRAVGLLLAALPGRWREPPVNALRLSLDPEGLAGWIEGAAAWRDHVLHRLRRQADATGDPALVALLAELKALPVPDAAATPDAQAAVPDDALAVPLALRTPFGRLSFITTVTVFGAPHDITLAEIAIETLLPADAETAEALRGWQAAGWRVPEAPGPQDGGLVAEAADG